MTTKNTFPAHDSKHETAKKWLQRQLRKTASRPVLRSSETVDGMQTQIKSIRPRTAPSTRAAPEVNAATPTPPIPIHIERASPSPQPPPRPMRPNSGVMRDVNAWLDASMSMPSPPLMDGISYWRAADGPGVKDTRDAQHAVPLPFATKLIRPATSQSQRAKSIRRRAKKIHVQMPALLRNRSQHLHGRAQDDRRSASMPLMAIGYDETCPGAPPKILFRSRSFLRSATPHTPAQAHTSLLFTGQRPLDELPLRRGTPATTRTGETESSVERRGNAMFIRPTRSADSTRPSTAAAGLRRDDSMGDLSDAPTYVSGPPPPSYRSRAASVLTTSSFGCIDGMSPSQREISRQRAAQRRGMKGKLKDFARNFVI